MTTRRKAAATAHSSEGATASAAQTPGRLEVIGADANNLKGVDVSFPLGQVTMVVGVSGSGKSSLLEDTLAVEAGRRMHTFLGLRPLHPEAPPPRAFISSMPATLLVGQRTFRGSARTTVGTATGLLATLRRLFLAAGRPHAGEPEREVLPPSAEQYARWLIRHFRGEAHVWAVPVRFAATDGVRVAERLRALGLKQVTVRSETDTPKVWEKGRTVSLERFKPLEPTVRHFVEADLGAMSMGPKTDVGRLQRLLERAFEAGGGAVVVELPGASQPELQGPFGPRLDSKLHYVDPELPTCLFPASTHLLSFNAPEHPESGACRTCHGLGRSVVLNEKALVVHPERSLHAGAFSLWTEKNYKYVNIQHETIEGLRGMRGLDPDKPWSRLPEEARRLVLEGAGSELVVDKERGTGRKMSAPRPFEGFRQAILERVARGSKVSQSLAFLVAEGPCTDCQGTRWSLQARALRVGGFGLHQLLGLPFSELATVAADKGALMAAVPEQARGLVRRLSQQAQAFVSVGLGHLTGDRGMLEVSGGEGRRTQLAGALNARNAGLCLLLDEPARGLHDEDLAGLAGAIAALTPAHTVVMNEHRLALARAADYLVKLSPNAGALGGSIDYEGPEVERLWEDLPPPERARSPVSSKVATLSVTGATLHNVRDQRCELPLGRLTCITGVSGSGKSSFIRGVLVPAVLKYLGKPAELEDFDLRQGSWSGFSVGDKRLLTGLVALDQRVPPTNRRSLVATFLELADRLRAAYGSSEPARAAGLSASDFGLNAGAGRCQRCLGIGEVEEQGLWTACPVCGGLRYGQEALSVRVEGLSMGELLALPASELQQRGLALLAPHAAALEAMVALGIGHLTLGRRVDTLSGGEVQRLRIARKLAEHGQGGLLFVLDEPAAGLHPRDVALLVKALDRILEGGRNTVVLVEHNLDIIQQADWLIEFGPGGGPQGGKVRYQGSPEKIDRDKSDKQEMTATGRALKEHSKRPELRRKSPRKLSPLELAPASQEQAARVTAWMRQLMGDDVAPPGEAPEETALEQPVVVLDERFRQGRRPWELLELDQELARLLIDRQVHRTGSPELGKDLDDLAARWMKQPEARLVIHPFLQEVQVWGARLPHSSVEVARKHMQAMGLELVTEEGGPLKKGAQVNGLKVRATGPRFVPREGGLEERKRLLGEALMLGGGYAELRTQRGEVVESLRTRLVDLERGLVAPMQAAPFHFSRHDPRGRCPVCKGAGGVLALKEELVIGNKRAALEDERMLHPSAAAILKGIRRGEMIPFFRRLAEEGLWTKDRPYQQLDAEERGLLLFGCWTRPGPGTFLKDAKADTSEVSSWLRWDGLYHHVVGQLERSTDGKWRQAIEQSRTTVECPECEGAGLSSAARLLMLGGRSLQEWVREGEAGTLRRALAELKGLTPRQERMRGRLLECLEPVARPGRTWKLHSLAEEEVAREVGERAVRLFTTMPVTV